MISKVVLEIEELFRMEIRFSPNNAKGGVFTITSICRTTFISVGDMSSWFSAMILL